VLSTGPVSTPCTYTETGKTVTLICEGDKTVFTVDDDGELNGPRGGMLGRLTRGKQQQDAAKKFGKSIPPRDVPIAW
jgi:hypothetical protein